MGTASTTVGQPNSARAALRCLRASLSAMSIPVTAGVDLQRIRLEPAAALNNQLATRSWLSAACVGGECEHDRRVA